LASATTRHILCVDDVVGAAITFRRRNVHGVLILINASENITGVRRHVGVGHREWVE